MRRFERSGMTGKIVERELFGKSLYEERTKEHAPDFTHYTYLRSIDVMKKFQPSSSTNPKPEFANYVRLKVCELMGLSRESVRFYTAIESPFDLFHKVDGWFEIKHQVQNNRVTVDLTTRPEKDSTKSDILFHVPIEGLSHAVDESEFLIYSNSLADQVAMEFNSRGIESRKGGHHG